MAVRLEHAGAAAGTTLLSSVTNADTTLSLVSTTGWPTGSVGPFVVTVEAGTASEEKMLILSRTGSTLAVQTRGYDSTVAISHPATSPIIHSFSAIEADEANALAAYVSGVGGSVVTTTAAQTLTNKTLTAPVINAPTGDVATLTGTQTLTNKTVSAASNTLVGVSFGTIGYAQSVAYQGGITTEVDLTSLSVAVTVGAGRRIKITVSVFAGATDAGGFAALRIKEGATQLQERPRRFSAASEVSELSAVVVLTPSTGAHTYKATMQLTSGTGSVSSSAGATYPAFILVEDVTV